MITKYKVGDVVKIKTHLIFGYNSSEKITIDKPMGRFFGMITTVIQIITPTGFYILGETEGWQWSDSMLETDFITDKVNLIKVICAFNYCEYVHNTVDLHRERSRIFDGMTSGDILDNSFILSKIGMTKINEFFCLFINEYKKNGDKIIKYIEKWISRKDNLQYLSLIDKYS